MKKLVLFLLMAAAPAVAQDFSQNSEARSWNLYAEEPARFEAKVVDILCELTGDCPADCGAGRRQLGLVRSVDGVLVFPNKNAQAAFSGAAVDLLPFCAKTVEVDGLLIEDPDIGAKNIYLVQRLRETGSEAWIKANNWTKNWAKTHPEAKGKGPWFRRDPRVKKHIEADGYFGLGQAVDQTYYEEEY